MPDRCTEHAENYFLYHCKRCDRPLCSRCIDRHEVGISSRKICPTCKGFVEPLGPGKIPFAGIVAEILRAPFASRTNLIVLAACIGLCSILETVAAVAAQNMFIFLTIPVAIIIAGVFSSFFALSVRSAARGDFDVPTHLEYTDWFDMVRPCLLFLASLFVSWLPGLIWIAAVYGFGAGGSLGAFEVAVGIALSLYGIVCWPMAGAIVLYTGKVAPALNPILILRFIARIPKGYAATYGLLIGMIAVASGFQLLVFLILGLSGIPFYVGNLLVWVVVFCFGFLGAEFLGGMLYAYCDVMGLELGQSLARRLEAEKALLPIVPAAGYRGGIEAPVDPPRPRPAAIAAPMPKPPSAAGPVPAEEPPARSTDELLDLLPELQPGALPSLAEAGDDAEFLRLSRELLDLPELPEELFEKRDKDNLFESLLHKYQLVDFSEERSDGAPVAEEAEERYEHRPTVDTFKPIDLPSAPPSGPIEEAAKPQVASDPGSVAAIFDAVDLEEQALLRPIALPGPTALPRSRAADTGPKAAHSEQAQKSGGIPMAVPISHLPDKTANVILRELERIAAKYLSRLQGDASYMLMPKTQWAVASHFERKKRWKEAVEAYSKAGLRVIRHRRASEGLLRAAYLSYRELHDVEVTRRLLRHLIDHYPDAISTEKAKRILKTIEEGGEASRRE